MSYSAILERSLAKPRVEISSSAFAFLFAEMVRYTHARIQVMTDFETKMARMGKRVGQRFAELLLYRERSSKREIKVINILILIQNNLWKMLFGKAAESLAQSEDAAHKYMLTDADLMVNKYCDLNCGSFVAGIIEAILEGANFPCLEVTAHDTDGGTTFLIEFDDSKIPAEALDAK
eukprot:m.37222 g.37222  ORF g.37222 m.37222 type:complete len:177 (-) comp12485_c0_seq1:100-630(-)